MSTNTIWATVPWNTSPTNTQKVNNEDKSILGKDDFLKILITQMKYQDPLEPMDTKESIAQMASFSALEQMQNLNKSFDNMSGVITNQLMPSMMLQQASTMIGRQVAYVNPELNENTPENEVVLVGRVSSVSIYDGLPVYIIDGHIVPFGDIVEMGETSNANDALTKILEKLESIAAALEPKDAESGEGEDDA